MLVHDALAAPKLRLDMRACRRGPSEAVIVSCCGRIWVGREVGGDRVETIAGRLLREVNFGRAGGRHSFENNIL